MSSMLKAIETENVIKNIIREISRECASGGINITDSCAAYMIKLMVWNPDHGFISDQPLARDDVKLLVDVCVQKLSEQNSPSLATIQMQVYFDTNFAPREEIINENRTNVKLRTAPLIKEIIETSAKSKEELEKLYRKMVVATIMRSGLGNPTHLNVLKEATAALSSVFPHSELSQFLAMSRREKEQQIKELTQITTGIRLFNRDCEKGGEGIEDLPNLLQKAINATQSSMESQLQKALKQATILTTVIEENLQTQGEVEEADENNKTGKEEGEKDNGEPREYEQATEEEAGTIQDEDLSELSKRQMNLILDGLTTARQQEVYIRKMLVEVDISQQMVAELLDKLKLRLTSIHETVRFRTAIPTVQVYPQFMHLSEIWSCLQDEMVVLSNMNNLLWNLYKYLEILDFIEEDVVMKMMGKEKILSDEARLKTTMGLKIDSSGLRCEVVYPAQVTDFDKIPLQYLGFCAWSLVKGQGALIPGNPNMGVCRWKGNYFAFSSPTAAAEFGQDPDGYVTAALNLVRRKPELINLLQLQEQITAMKIAGELPIKKPEPIIKRDCEIQTELHPIPTFIDPTYKWNEWDLKREAIKLTNITNRRTKSVQTQHSFHRASIGLQTNPPKNQQVQTMKDGSSNVPTLQNYIYGLRGRKDDKQFVMTLTRPVHE